MSYSNYVAGEWWLRTDNKLYNVIANRCNTSVWLYRHYHRLYLLF